ncbi:phenylacetic acid degradation operon negative regulatory protein PaaX [Pseudoduganella sp. GCM10020061]|uniref:phenylacetic acid degradation operon negative regulatory protein PaaX n=1 Tax=Pseudoduganella sp. GCM10020061 TaxID=3317345 RepID=UPI0036380CC6
MKHLTIPEWIAHFLAADPPRSKSLVMTVFGDAVSPHGGSVWLGSLIELAAPFGISDRLVRTSVFRLAQEGWLAAARDGRRSAYTIAPSALARFEHANRRIYLPLDGHWDGSWTLLLAGASPLGAAERTRLRKELAWEGYAQLAPGVLGHPAGSAEVLDEVLTRLALHGQAPVCSVRDLPGTAGRPLRELVGECWDLAPVIASYLHFADVFGPLLALLRRGCGALSPQQAFVVRTLLVHAYRRVQLHDPMLPMELLPAPWPGAQAYELAREIYRATFALAEQHVMEVLRREDPDAPQADASFYDRFGGLE